MSTNECDYIVVGEVWVRVEGRVAEVNDRKVVVHCTMTTPSDEQGAPSGGEGEPLGVLHAEARGLFLQVK